MVSASGKWLSTFYNGAISRSTMYNTGAQRTIRPMSERNFRPVVCVPSPIREIFLVPSKTKDSIPRKKKRRKIEGPSPANSRGRGLCGVHVNTAHWCAGGPVLHLFRTAVRRTLRVLTCFSFFLVGPSFRVRCVH